MKASLVRPLLLALVPLGTAHADDCANATHSEERWTSVPARPTKRPDAELNRVYQPGHEQTQWSQVIQIRLLVAAEKNWLAFRDTECAFVGARSAGGSVQPMVIIECRDNLVQPPYPSNSRAISTARKAIWVVSLPPSG